MRRLLGTVPALAITALLLTGLAACGEDTAPTASDPSPTTPATTPTTPPTSAATSDPTKSPPLTPGAVDFELVEIVSATAGGGTATGQAVELTASADVDAFVADLADPLADDVRTAYAAHPVQDGQSLWAAVVAVGCDVPPGVDVTATATAGGYRITGTKVAEPLQECFAPVTSVALVAING